MSPATLSALVKTAALIAFGLLNWFALWCVSQPGWLEIVGITLILIEGAALLFLLILASEMRQQ